MKSDTWEKMKDAEKIDVLLLRVNDLDTAIQKNREWCVRLRTAFGKHLGGEGMKLLTQVEEPL